MLSLFTHVVSHQQHTLSEICFVLEVSWKSRVRQCCACRGKGAHFPEPVATGTGSHHGSHAQLTSMPQVKSKSTWHCNAPKNPERSLFICLPYQRSRLLCINMEINQCVVVWHLFYQNTPINSGQLSCSVGFLSPQTSTPLIKWFTILPPCRGNNRNWLDVALSYAVLNWSLNKAKLTVDRFWLGYENDFRGLRGAMVYAVRKQHQYPN